MKKLAILVMFALPLAGCAHLDSRAISYADGPPGADTNYQRLFIWGSDYSAGMGTRSGICAQAATTAQARSSKTKVEAGNGVLAALNPAQLASLDEGKLAAISRATNESVMLTNATNGQTAFANIAFFYLCQISLNGQLPDTHIATMWEKTINAVANVAKEGVKVNSIEAAQQSLSERSITKEPEGAGGGSTGGVTNTPSTGDDE
jgi:hypothetical protein